MAGTDEIVLRESLAEQRNLDLSKYSQYFDLTQSAILTPGDAKALLLAASAADGVVKENSENPKYGTKAGFAKIDAADYYCVIHVLSWGSPAKDDKGFARMKPDKHNWYVYHGGKTWRQEDFKDNKRMYGSKNVWLLFIHLNIAPEFGYAVRYDVDLKDITPAPLGHLLDLAKLMAGGAGEANDEVRNIWGAHNIAVNHVPNEMTVTAESVSIATANRESTTERLGDPVKFVNEGRYP